MKPTEGVRRWVNEVMGIDCKEDDLAELLGAWEIVSQAVGTVNECVVEVETEPATQMSSCIFGGLQALEE
jgi:hypothetical protein